mmetsp:Transcript_6812/g.16779  ORF Transcript_6812/g.16779 Transcript_6812/m.16779 type:complete len:336 (-) Transcript_6812:36-1043(-)
MKVIFSYIFFVLLLLHFLFLTLPLFQVRPIVSPLPPRVPLKPDRIQLLYLILRDRRPLPVQDELVHIPLPGHPVRQRPILLPLPRYVGMAVLFLVPTNLLEPILPRRRLDVRGDAPVEPYFLEEAYPIRGERGLPPRVGVAVMRDLRPDPHGQFLIGEISPRNVRVAVDAPVLLEPLEVREPLLRTGSLRGSPIDADPIQQKELDGFQRSLPSGRALPAEPAAQVPVFLPRLLVREGVVRDVVAIVPDALELDVPLPVPVLHELPVIIVPRRLFQQQVIGPVLHRLLGRPPRPVGDVPARLEQLFQSRDLRRGLLGLPFRLGDSLLGGLRLLHLA